jgi:transposase-like protein
MQSISYSRHRFPPDIIRHAIWRYLRFTLSYRDGWLRRRPPEMTIAALPQAPSG